MSKKDIGEIIATGSAKQRLILFWEDAARAKYRQERRLTDQMMTEISESFKKPNEIRLWNKWVKIDRKVYEATVNLQGLKFQVLMHYSSLRGYILIWETIQEAEVLSNHILYEIKDKKERIKIASQAGRLGNFLFTDIQTDKEGYLDINIGLNTDAYKDKKSKLRGKNSLWHFINNAKEQALNSAIVFLSWREAILDYMKEEGFSIKFYKDTINLMTESVHEPIIGWTKDKMDEQQFIPGKFNKRADELKAKCSIAPDTRELEADPAIYNYFKKEFLRNEE